MLSEFRCPKCGYSRETKAPACERCGLIFEKFKVSVNPHRQAPNRYLPYDSFKLNLLALPITFFLAFLISKIWVLYALAANFITIPVHELGHAIAAWSSSRPAIPLGAFIPAAAFTTILSKSPIFGLIYVFLFLYGLFQSYKNRRVFPLVVLSAALIAFLKLSFFSSEDTETHAFVIGGIWGEIWISTVLILSFFHPFLIKYRYDFFRFFTLFGGCNVFWHAWELWSKSAKNVFYLPMGSYIDGSDSQSGDLQKLIHQYHWESVHLAKTTLSFVHICLAIIIAQYLWAVFRSRREVA